MKLAQVLLVLAALLLASPARADDPGPYVPCYMILSDGTVIGKHKDRVPLSLIIKVLRDSYGTQAGPKIELAKQIYRLKTFDDVWEHITQRHRECMRNIQNGKPAGY